MKFSLRHLEVFAATARLESISAAAEALAMSQSAASAALLEFERRYDRPVFDRFGKRLKINETGRALLPEAREMLDRAQEIDALLAGRRGPGPFRLGAGSAHALRRAAIHARCFGHVLGPCSFRDQQHRAQARFAAPHQLAP